jgi:hypothetical protein
MPVYAKPLTLNKGVDNQIQFQFLNQEQKPVDITGKTITCRVISYDGLVILLEKTLTLTLPATGIATLDVAASDIESVDPQKGSYSLVIPTGEFDYPVFVDQNAGARGQMEITDSIFPIFVPSMPITIPTGQEFPNANPSANANSTVLTYHSSAFSTEDASILTLSIQLDNYYGNIVTQGSAIIDGDWYPIAVAEYMGANSTLGFTIEGYHSFVRVEFNSPLGNVGNILAR